MALRRDGRLTKDQSGAASCNGHAIAAGCSLPGADIALDIASRHDITPAADIPQAATVDEHSVVSPQAFGTEAPAGHDGDASQQDPPLEWPEHLNSDDEDATRPCTACSFTRLRQSRCRYKSNVKIIYECSDRGVWSIGNRYILKERGSKGGDQEIIAARFIQERTTIPVPEIVDEWTEPSGRRFVLMKRVPGESLQAAWPSLSDEAKERIAIQVADCVKQLRSLVSSRMEYLAGGTPTSWVLSEHVGKASITSDDDLWLAIESGLDLPEQSRKNLHSIMPPSEPWTFSHADLTAVNIMVHNGNLSGILDWEHAGYFPVWYEYAALRIGESPEDLEWKALLRKAVDRYAPGARFYLALYILRLEGCEGLAKEVAKLKERLAEEEFIPPEDDEPLYYDSETSDEDSDEDGSGSDADSQEQTGSAVAE